MALSCNTVKPNKYAFTENLHTLTLKRSVKEISATSFLGCRSLREIVFLEGVERIGEKAFYNCSTLQAVKLPDSLKAIGKDAFADCRAIKEVHLPSNLKYLPEGAFKNCTSIEKIVLPQSLEVIGKECFSGCTGLQEIVFSDMLVRIEDRAFKRCENLKELIFPESLEYIGNNAFSACHSLSFVKLNSQLDFLGKQPFCNHVLNQPQVTGMAYCSSFLTDADKGKCPTISIPRNVNRLLLGFSGMLSHTDIRNNKTCFDHILSFEKNSVKIFISENYYSYKDENDYLLQNGEFDFEKYDKQFYKASSSEKPFISAFRLVYNKSLSQADEAEYKKALAGNEKTVAEFSAERNEPEVLSYLLKNSSFDSSFYTVLYNIAIEKGNKNLLDIISLHSKNTGVSEVENLFSDLL